MIQQSYYKPGQLRQQPRRVYQQNLTKSCSTQKTQPTQQTTYHTQMSQSQRLQTRNINEFYVHETIGQGAYSDVKLVQDKITSQQSALKIVSKQKIKQFNATENIIQELRIHKSLHHKNIIKVQDIFEDTFNYYILLEYCDKGNLFQYIQKNENLSEQEAFIYFYQTCAGIDYLHKNHIIHRDIKPENILITSNTTIKICDFNWAVIIPPNQKVKSAFCGTIEYMAPEIILNKPQDQKVDTWALGILLYEILHGQPPFQGRNDKEKCQDILKNNFYIKDTLSSECQDLIKSLLQPDPDHRLTISQIARHQWVQKYLNKPENQRVNTTPSSIQSSRKSSTTEQSHRSPQRRWNQQTFWEKILFAFGLN